MLGRLQCRRSGNGNLKPKEKGISTGNDLLAAAELHTLRASTYRAVLDAGQERVIDTFCDHVLSGGEVQQEDIEAVNEL